MVKRKMDQNSNDGSNPAPISKYEKSRAHILEQKGNNEASDESSMGIGGNTKEKMKSKHKKVNDLRPLEKISDGTSAANVLSKANHESSTRIRNKDITKVKSKRLNGSERFKTSGKFCDEGISSSESKIINYSVKENRKYEELKKNMEKENPKEITGLNFLKNATVEGGANLKDEIIYGVVGEKGQKKQRKEENYNANESFTTCTDSYNLDEAKKQGRKRKTRNYSQEFEGGGDSIKKKVKEVPDNAYNVISGGDAHMIPSSIQRSKKKKKLEHANRSMGGFPKLVLEATRKDGDFTSTVAKCNYDENNKSYMASLDIGKGSNINGSYDCEPKKDAIKNKKKVTFSNIVEVFPVAQCSKKKIKSVSSGWGKHFTEEDELNLVWGKRFTPEEDELIRKATNDYIEANQLGDQGLHKILHCSKYRKQLKDCWKVIASALPWRPLQNIYLRAHTIFERNVECKWEPEELELLKRCYAQYGPNWKKLGEIFGKSRHQVKDTYRRIKAENLKKGKWGQIEYQALFDLVNLDLQMKAFQEKKESRSLLKNNISWESISSELSTRGPQACCLKWYLQLTSSMVSGGHWTDLDDYKLIDAIQKTDPVCFEDVDWDNLLENRSGEICRKRWYEMIRYLDRFWALSFVEQIDLLSQRYCPDMIQYIQKDLNTNPLT